MSLMKTQLWDDFSSEVWNVRSQKGEDDSHFGLRNEPEAAPDKPPRAQRHENYNTVGCTNFERIYVLSLSAQSLGWGRGGTTSREPIERICSWGVGLKGEHGYVHKIQHVCWGAAGPNAWMPPFLDAPYLRGRPMAGGGGLRPLSGRCSCSVIRWHPSWDGTQALFHSSRKYPRLFRL